jgi:hypothetical protein
VMLDQSQMWVASPDHRHLLKSTLLKQGLSASLLRQFAPEWGF